MVQTRPYAGKRNEYAMYKGDTLMGIGTSKELAELRGVKLETIWFYMCPAYQRRCKGTNKIIVVKLDDSEDDDI